MKIRLVYKRSNFMSDYDFEGEVNTIIFNEMIHKQHKIEQEKRDKIKEKK